MLLVILVTEGLALLLMDSEYNYVAKNEDPKNSFKLSSTRVGQTCPQRSISEHFLKIKSQAIDFCPDFEKDEKEEVQEAESPTAPLKGLDDLIRPSEQTTDPGEPNKPTDTDEERYVVKAVPIYPEKDVKEPDEVISEKNSLEHPKVVEVQHTVELNQSAGTVEISNEASEANRSSTSEAEIPSFREYTQKALEKEQKERETKMRKKTTLNHQSEGNKESNKTTNVNINSVAGGLKKNFASLDCGAKIAAANAESQSATNIFTPSRDEYMRNACSDKAWFVVELCESIKALKIEIANHELYSSVFKDFRVSLSNVYPGRDKDWSLFGQFEAKDERFTQAFASSEAVFGKYVKVEILSHHGNEYFCPISSFKIYGISEIELIGADDLDEPDHDHDPDPDHDPGGAPSATSTDNSMVLNIIKATFQRIAAGVFAPNEQIKDLDMSQALNQSSLEGSTFLYDVSCPGCDDNRLRDVYFLLASNYAQLSQTLAKNKYLSQALSQRVCQSYGLNSGSIMVDFYATLFGSSRILALCNVISIESGDRDPAFQSQALVLPPWQRSVQNRSESPAEHSVQDQDSTKLSISQDTSQTTAVLPTLQTSMPDSVSSLESSKTLDASNEVQVTLDKVVPSVTRSKSVTTEHSDRDVQSNQPMSTNLKIEPTPASESREAVDTTTTTNATPGAGHLKEPPEVVFVPPPADKLNSDTNAGGGQRESVWQKLSNKIKALERNVSLSGGYLEELSVQYKKQIEDLQLAVRQSGEALAAASKAREHDQHQVKDLKEEVSQLKVVVEEVSTRMETMSTWAVVVHSLFLVVEIFIGVLFVFACWTSRTTSSRTEKSATKHLPSSTPIKRRHSLQDKSTCLVDSHHIEELKATKRRASLDLTLRMPPSSEGLSKRQRKRLQRRLSRANAVLHESPPGTDQATEKASGVHMVNGFHNPDHDTKEDLKLTNTFGILNHSQHGDPYFEALTPLDKRKFILSGGGRGSNASSTRSATPESTARSTPSHRAGSKKSKKRSKSTSPPRKIESKQRDLFKNFDPDNVDWIQSGSSISNLKP